MFSFLKRSPLLWKSKSCLKLMCWFRIYRLQTTECVLELPKTTHFRLFIWFLFIFNSKYAFKQFIVQICKLGMSLPGVLKINLSSASDFLSFRAHFWISLSLTCCWVLGLTSCLWFCTSLHMHLWSCFKLYLNKDWSYFFNLSYMRIAATP